MCNMPSHLNKPVAQIYIYFLIIRVTRTQTSIGTDVTADFSKNVSLWFRV